MTDKSRDAKVEKIEYRMRAGKEYIVINQASWYPTDSYTQETATEDYIFTHSNNGFNFVPRFAEKRTSS